MDILSMEFLTALTTIIIIDLVLAGDNAIVIALATRNLPKEIRRSAIIWGTAGAVIVRCLMTFCVVWLLKVPGLMLAGGLMLIWIAYKLLVNQSDNNHEVSSSSNFWAAMKTIVVADLVMGLDNVLAVAGASHGSFLLVTIGLLISIPIVVLGSQLILKVVDRYPYVIYLGAAVLAGTAAKMITSEPLIQEFLTNYPLLKQSIFIFVIAGTLGISYCLNELSKRRSTQELAQIDNLPENSENKGIGYKNLRETLKGIPTKQKREIFQMEKILIPVDSSENSINAVQYAITIAELGRPTEIHLVHVRQPLPNHIGKFLSNGERRRWHENQAKVALCFICDLLDQKGIAYTKHIKLGEIVTTINRLARHLKVSQIIIGSTPMPIWIRILSRSITTSLLETSSIPVQIISGKQPSIVKKYGLPASLATILAMLILANE